MRKLRASKPKKEQRVTKPRKNLWSAYIYDCSKHVIDHYSTTFDEIVRKAPSTAWRFPNISKLKWYGALVGAALPVFWVVAIMSSAPMYSVIAIMMAMLLFMPLALAGYFMVPAIMKRRVWWCRPYVKFYSFDGNLVPIEWTDLTGVHPAVYQELKNEQPDEEWPDTPYACDAWESLYSPLHQHFLNRIPMTLADKIKIGAMIMLTLSVVGLTFFIVMATQGS